MIFRPIEPPKKAPEAPFFLPTLQSKVDNGKESKGSDMEVLFDPGEENWGEEHWTDNVEKSSDMDQGQEKANEYRVTKQKVSTEQDKRPGASSSKEPKSRIFHSGDGNIERPLHDR